MREILRGVTLCVVVAALNALALPGSASAQDELFVETVTRLASDPTEVEIAVDVTTDQLIRVFSFVLAHDNTEMEAISADAEPVLDFFDYDPAFISIVVDDPDGEVEMDAILTEIPTADPLTLQESTGLRTLIVTYDVLPAAPTGVTLAVTLSSNADVTLEYQDEDNLSIVPASVDGGVVNLADPSGAEIADELMLVGLGDPTLARLEPDPGGLAISGSTPLDDDPAAVTVTIDGITWVTFPGTDEVGRYEVDGTEIDLLSSGDRPTGIASDKDGFVWVGCVDEVWKYGPDGEVLFGGDGLLGPAIEVIGDIYSLAVDGDDSVWGLAINDTDGGTLFKISGDNIPVSGTFLEVDRVIDNVTELNDLAIDRDGFVWVTTNEGIQRRRSNGTIAEEFKLEDGESPRNIIMHGKFAAYVTEADSATVHRLVPGQEAELFFELPDSGSPTGLTISGEGFIFVADENTVYALDPAEVPPVTELASLDVSATFSPLFRGDVSGYALANTIATDDDFDADGDDNASEIDASTNFLDNDNSPTTPPVRGLICESSEDGEAFLTWENPISYARVEVVRSDGDMETLGGDAEEYVDSDLEDGSYQYAVIGIPTAPTAPNSPPRECRVQIGVGSVLSNEFDLEFQDTKPVDVALVTEDTFSINFNGVVPPVVMFVLYPNGTILGFNAMAQPVLQFQSPCPNMTGLSYVPFADSGNGSLLLAGEVGVASGRDVCEVNLTGGLLATWDISPPIMDDIESLAFVQTDSDDGVLFASAPDTCEVWAFCYSTMTFEGAFDHPGGASGSGSGLAAIASTISCGSPINFTGGQESSTIALSVFDDLEGVYKIRYYDVDLANDTVEENDDFDVVPLFQPTDGENSFMGFDIGQLDVFGNRSQRNSAFLLGNTSGSAYALDAGGAAPANEFLRGDCDGNGLIFPIIDALYLLDYGFTGGTVPPCLDAADVDGSDDVFPIVDVLYLLDYGFTDGPAPPDPGPSSCGPDPEGDSDGVTCETPSTGC